MITVNGKRIVDIILYQEDTENYTRIKKAVTSNSDIVYNNKKANIYVNNNTTEDPGTSISTCPSQYLNIGDIARYYITIQNKPYLITDIECSSSNVDISDNGISYNKEGQYEVTLKYKTYTIKRNVIVSHIAVALA